MPPVGAGVDLLCVGSAVSGTFVGAFVMLPTLS